MGKCSGWLERLKIDKRLYLILIIGALGILLLTLSEVLPENENSDEININSSSSDNLSDYEKELEERLSGFLKAVDGAGDVLVMVTLDCSDENIYATENKSDEKSYVVIRSNGDDNGLLLKTSLPQIRGVAVLCEGADSAEVCCEITELLTAVLGVSANRVNISKMKTGYGG